jgi:electron transfer flavoprotein alpha subunit
MSNTKDVWILVEQNEGQLEDISLGLVSEGRRIADELKEEVCAVAVRTSEEELAETLASYGADKVYFLDSPLLSKYSPELYVEALSNLFREENPEILLCGTTLIGRDLATRLAARLKTNLVQECIGLAVNEKGLLLQTKLTHEGKVSNTILCPTSKPQMATVICDAMSIRKPDPTRKPKVIIFRPKIDQKEPCKSIIKSFIRADLEKTSLEEADIIVAGGRGMGNAENLRLLAELAKSLGGVVAGSQPVIEAGWLPRNRQVGQTGMIVTPKLYIACGISGSIYHVQGMKDSKIIIAINKDYNAPIFKLADIGIVGDVVELISAIIDQLHKSPLSCSAT